MFHYMRGEMDEATRENKLALKQAKAGGYEILALILEENLADSLWVAGDLPQALSAARHVIEQCKRGRVAHKIPWGWIYGNLFGILVESGQLAEALEVGRETMRFLREANSAWMIMDHYALRLASAGDMEAAARVHGWINAEFLRRGNTRQPNELRAMNSTARILNTHFSAVVLGNLCAESLQDKARARAHYLKVLETDSHHPKAAEIRYWLAANP